MYKVSTYNNMFWLQSGNYCTVNHGPTNKACGKKIIYLRKNNAYERKEGIITYLTKFLIICTLAILIICFYSLIGSNKCSELEL